MSTGSIGIVVGIHQDTPAYFASEGRDILLARGSIGSLEADRRQAVEEAGWESSSSDDSEYWREVGVLYPRAESLPHINKLQDSDYMYRLILCKVPTNNAPAPIPAVQEDDIDMQEHKRPYLAYSDDDRSVSSEDVFDEGGPTPPTVPRRQPLPGAGTVSVPNTEILKNPGYKARKITKAVTAPSYGRARQHLASVALSQVPLKKETVRQIMREGNVRLLAEIKRKWFDDQTTRNMITKIERDYYDYRVRGQKNDRFVTKETRSTKRANSVIPAAVKITNQDDGRKQMCVIRASTVTGTRGCWDLHFQVGDRQTSSYKRRQRVSMHTECSDSLDQINLTRPKPTETLDSMTDPQKCSGTYTRDNLSPPKPEKAIRTALSNFREKLEGEHDFYRNNNPNDSPDEAASFIEGYAQKFTRSAADANSLESRHSTLKKKFNNLHEKASVLNDNYNNLLSQFQALTNNYGTLSSAHARAISSSHQQQPVQGYMPNYALSGPSYAVPQIQGPTLNPTLIKPIGFDVNDFPIEK